MKEGKKTKTLRDPVTQSEAAKIVEDQRLSRPDHPIEECIPEKGVLADYMAYARLAATNSADIYHVGASIPTLLSELNYRDFTVDGIGDAGENRPLTVFSLLLGPSGDGKSTGAVTAMKHICSVLESDEEANTGKNPRPRRLEFDGTPEGLRHSLITNYFNEKTRSTTALLFHEELTQMFARGNTHTAEFLQRMYDGRTIVEQQRQHQKQQRETGQDMSRIEAPRINAVFCSTPDNLSHVLTKTMASGGLYGRLLIFVGESRPHVYEGYRLRNRDACDKTRQASEISISEWCGFLDATAATQGRVLKISDAAHKVFDRWDTEHYEIIQATNAEDNLRSMISRANRTAWTISGLYATTQFRHIVNAEDAEQACKLVDRCFHMGKVLDRRLGQSLESKMLDALLEGIRKAGKKGVFQADMYDLTGVTNKGLTSTGLKQMLDTLVESEDIVGIAQERKGPGRKATVFYATEFAPKIVEKTVAAN